jgi:hypothetical protein
MLKKLLARRALAEGNRERKGWLEKSARPFLISNTPGSAVCRTLGTTFAS